MLHAARTHGRVHRARLLTARWDSYRSSLSIRPGRSSSAHRSRWLCRTPYSPSWSAAYPVRHTITTHKSLPERCCCFRCCCWAVVLRSSPASPLPHRLPAHSQHAVPWAGDIHRDGSLWEAACERGRIVGGSVTQHCPQCHAALPALESFQCIECAGPSELSGAVLC